MGDYASVVAQLIKIFVKITERDELALYHDLANANCDVVRVRAGEYDDSSLAVNDGVNLIVNSRDMLRAAACSLSTPKRYFRPGRHNEAKRILDHVHLGQTEHGSFVLTLLIPIDQVAHGLIKRMTEHLIGALGAAKSVANKTTSGDEIAFSGAVEKGVSANLCEALYGMISPFRTLDVEATWALTRLMKQTKMIVRFANSDAFALRRAAQSFRDLQLRRDGILLSGKIYATRRDVSNQQGIVKLWDDERRRSVKIAVKGTDYDRLVEAHRREDHVILGGDLQSYGQRLTLLNAGIVSISQSRDDTTTAT